MSNARAALLRQAHILFDLHIAGLYRFTDAILLPSEPIDRPEGWKPLRKLPDAERVRLHFGPVGREYKLTVRSSGDAPPLGEIVVEHPRGIERGTLDSTTWERVGAFIRRIEGTM